MDLSGHIEPYFTEAHRPVIALGSDYPDGHCIPPHRQRRDQLLHGSTGVVTVNTAEGAWVMPPERGMWIPAGTLHEVRMLGAVKMRSLYFEPRATDGMPDRCTVLGLSRLMRCLLLEAAKI